MGNIKLYAAGILCIALIGCMSGCAEKTAVSIENELGQQDLFDLDGHFYKETCFEALHRFEHLYSNRKTNMPDYTATRLERFWVHGSDHSTKIKRIDFAFIFDDGNTTFLQTVVITDGRIHSYISSSPKAEASGDADDTISLSEFITALDGIDFSYFTEMKPNADQYGFEYAGMSDIVYQSTEGVKRYLVAGDDITENCDEDMSLDRYVPVVLFTGAMETQPGAFSDDMGLQIYIHQ